MLDRRNFLCALAAPAVVGANAALFGAVETPPAERPYVPEPRNPNPYQNVDWNSAQQIHTTSHHHATDQAMLQPFLDRGFEFLTLSNYYPSAPYYPLDKMTDDYYRVHHDHAVVVDGKATPGPFDWNAIVSEWIDELDEKHRKYFPFQEGDKSFVSYPKNILQAPNAEHHSFSDWDIHVCAPGSSFASGTFDAHNEYQTHSRGYHFGVGLPWREGFDKMFAGLIEQDGGGVTINHPRWSNLQFERVVEMLDYDPRVLGIEVFNMSDDGVPYPDGKSFNEEHWDYALRSGRQCFGFFVPDWGVTQGTNILLVQERTAAACLRAYRQGNWYGAVMGRRILNFQQIAFDGETLTARTDKPARFEVVAAPGVVYETKGKSFSFAVATAERKRLGYLRIRAFATDDSGEILFSQPFMLS